MILNPHDDVGIDVVRDSDIVGHTAAAATSLTFSSGTATVTYTSRKVGESANRILIGYNAAGPATPTVTESGNTVTINYLAGTTMTSAVMTAVNASSTLISGAFTGTDALYDQSNMGFNPMRMFGGADYHGHWGDAARQYDNGDDTTPGAVTRNGQGWPTWEPAVPDMRALWFTQNLPWLNEGGLVGNGWPTFGTGSVATGYDATAGFYRTLGTAFTATGYAGSAMGAQGSSQLTGGTTSHVARYEAVFRIPTLTAPATDAFLVYLGLCVGGATGPGGTAACFQIPADGTNIVAYSTDSALSTTTDTGIAAVAGTWYRAVIVFTQSTKAEFYLVPLGTPLPATPTATITTTLPQHGMGAVIGICKTLGTNARTVDFTFQMVSVNKLAA